MDIGNLVDRVLIRGLVVNDDETGIHVCHDFNPDTSIIQFDRAFFERATPRAILSMIDEVLERSVHTTTALELSSADFPAIGYGEIHSQLLGVAPPAPAPNSKMKRVLTRCVQCGILLSMSIYGIWTLKKRRK